MELLNYIIKELKNNKTIFQAQFSNLSKEEQIWKPEEKRWNHLEILCHLYDEEREDFRARLNSILEDPTKPFVQIDPAGWVKSRNYAEQNFETVLNDFLKERDASIAWLGTLEKANWENAYLHPKVGPLSGTFMLANWLAHDQLHIRQLLKLKYDQLLASSGQSLDYAGNW